MKCRMSLLSVVVALAVTSLLVACGKSGSGVEKSEDRTVEAFSSIALEGAAKVTVEVGQPLGVTVRTDDNLLALLKTSVENDVLKVAFAEDVSTKIGVNVTVQTPKLSAISITGAAEISASGLSGEAFELKIEGAGKATLKGAVGQAKIECKGASSIDASALKAQDGVVSLSGAGNVDIHAEKTLDVTIKGVGKIGYTGSPKLTQKVDGAGKITQK